MTLKPDSVSRSEFREKPLYALWNSLLFVFVVVPLQGAAFLWRQATGTVSNVRSFIRWVQVDYFLPPFIRDQLQWAIETLPQAAGLRGTSRNRQIASAVVTLAVAFFSVVVTGGLAIAGYVIAGAFLLAGTARFVPWVNGRWKEAQENLGIKDDYDLPRWSRD